MTNIYKYDTHDHIFLIVRFCKERCAVLRLSEGCGDWAARSSMTIWTWWLLPCPKRARLQAAKSEDIISARQLELQPALGGHNTLGLGRFGRCLRLSLTEDVYTTLYFIMLYYHKLMKPMQSRRLPQPEREAAWFLYSYTCAAGDLSLVGTSLCKRSIESQPHFGTEPETTELQTLSAVDHRKGVKDYMYVQMHIQLPRRVEQCRVVKLHSKAKHVLLWYSI